MSQPQTHQFHMEMTCEGCSGAAKRVLGKLEDATDITADLNTKTVTVTSALSSDELLAVLQKTGKAVTYIGVKE